MFVSSFSHREEESHFVVFEDKIIYASILGPHYIIPLDVSKLGSGEKKVCTKVSKVTKHSHTLSEISLKSFKNNAHLQKESLK